MHAIDDDRCSGYWQVSNHFLISPVGKSVNGESGGRAQPQTRCFGAITRRAAKLNVSNNTTWCCSSIVHDVLEHAIRSGMAGRGRATFADRPVVYILEQTFNSSHPSTGLRRRS